MTRRGAVNHLHGAQAPEKPTGNRSSALARRVRAVSAAVLCGSALLSAPTADRASAAGMEFEFLFEPVSANLVLEYVHDLAFSQYDDYPPDMLASSGEWPVRIEFFGDSSVNQFVNRWGNVMDIYLGSNIANDRLLFAKEIMTYFSKLTNDRVKTINLSFGNVAEGEDFHIHLKTASNLDEMGQMRREAFSQYMDALKKGKSSKAGYKNPYIAKNVRNIMSVFAAPKGDLAGKGCFYIGAVDDDYTVRSGAIVMHAELNDVDWRSCYLRGIMRFAGFLGEVGKYPSSMRNAVSAVDPNLYEMLALEAFYNLDIENGTPAEKAMRALEDSIR